MTAAVAPSRVHVWSRAAFCHLRRYRCGVYVGPGSSSGDLCAERPMYAVELRRGLRVRLAVCARHAAEARADGWDGLTAIWNLRASRSPR